MKRKMIAGMVLTSLLASSAFAAGPTLKAGSGKGLTTRVEEYQKKVNSHVYGQGRTSAQGLADNALKIANDKIFTKLKLAADERSALAVALQKSGTRSAQDVEATLETLTVVLNTRLVGEAMKQEGNAEGQSVIDAADAVVKAIGETALLGAKGKNGKSSSLSADEQATSSGAVLNLLKIAKTIPTMEKGARENFTSLLKEFQSESRSNSGKTAEEAMLAAAMKLKNGDRKAALELLRRLKDCA